MFSQVDDGDVAGLFRCAPMVSRDRRHALFARLKREIEAAAISIVGYSIVK